MHILYVNPNLMKRRSALGIWGRHVLEGMRAGGAEVSSFPAAPDTGPSDGPDDGGVGWHRAFLYKHASRDWVARLFEYFLVARGIARTVRASLSIWRQRHHLDVDVVLGRAVEYDLTPQVAARILRRPLVLEVHSPHFLERQMRGRPPWRVIQVIERWQWRQCTRIWVNSLALKTILGDHGYPADRIRVILFGVDLDRFPPRTARGVGNPVRIVFTGSFYPWHGTDVLLRAFASAQKRIGGLHLTLIGDGTGRPASENLARALGIADLVDFTGWLAYDRVIEHLTRADIGVAPYTRLDPFYFDPVKIREYMACGLAVVGSDQGSIPEMLEHGESGLLVPPGDEDALAAALVRLAEDRELAERLGGAARRRAETAYNWPEIIPKVLALCAEAAAGHRDGRAQTRG